MKTTRPALLAAVTLGGLLSLSGSAPAKPPAPSGTSYAAPPAAAPVSASPSASASAATAESGPLGKRVEEDPPGAEKSSAPTLTEWRDAARIDVTRRDNRCNAYRVREWIKIHCSFPAAGVAQMAGSPEGVAVWVDRTAMEIEKVAFAARGVEVIFPVRRGDARYFEMLEWFADYMFPSGQTVSVSISEQWIEGEPAPIITM